MSLVRLLPAWFHAIADYAVAGTLIAVAAIVGGSNDLRQILARPMLRMNPYATPVAGWYLCSASTPPGGGVHGMCGFNAAQSALRRSFS